MYHSECNPNGQAGRQAGGLGVLESGNESVLAGVCDAPVNPLTQIVCS